MFKKIFKAIILDCFVLCYVTVANYPIIISLVPLIRYTRPLRLAKNWSTQPLSQGEKTDNPPLLCPRHTPPSHTYGQSLKYIGILNIAVLYTY